MVKEIKYLIYLLVIISFVLFNVKYYFSDEHKKKSYRSLSNINKKIEIYSKKIPTLNDDTKDIIEYVKNTKTKKKEKILFLGIIR